MNFIARQANDLRIMENNALNLKDALNMALFQAIEGLNTQISSISERIDALNERVSELDARDPDPDMTMDPQLTKFSEAVMGVINHNAEDIAEAVWQEIESKVDDAATCAADYAIDHMDAADVVRRGLKDIL